MASDKQGRRFRRPRFSTVIALVALFAALGGAAYAGSKINGKNIKKNTVASKAIKNGTLKAKDMSTKAVDSLKGEQGPQGPQGPKGAKGATGPAGADGVIEPESGEFGNVNLTDGALLGIGTVNVSAGTSYVVNAKTNLFAGPGVTRIDCFLNRNGATIDTASWNPPANNTRVPVPLQAVVDGPGGTITVGCESTGGTSSASNTRITALPVG